MLDLYLIRHAECESNRHDKDFMGGRQNESPLTQDGIVQANYLGLHLAGRNMSFDEVYTSPAVRARRTAEIVSQRVQFPLEKIVGVDALQELSHGLWEKRLRKEVHTPEQLKIINADNWNFKAPEGESQKEVEERLYGWIEQTLLPRYETNSCVGVFGHSTAFKCVLRRILESTPKMTHKIVIKNTAITQLQYDHEGWHVLRINDAAHLAYLR